MQRLQYPFPIFSDQAGNLLDAGKVYIGTASNDPEQSPITVYWDLAGTLPATQPLRTRGGLIVNNGAPAVVYIPATDYSMRVRDSGGNQVQYAATTTDIGGSSGASYQPLDDDLTAIAALTTTAFGRSLLTQADATAVKTLLGIVTGLALTGGTVSGNILRQGAGPHIYHNDPAMTSGRIFITAVGAADPTSLPGDIWLQVA
jgi:hypothetical protein